MRYEWYNTLRAQRGAIILSRPAKIASVDFENLFFNIRCQIGQAITITIAAPRRTHLAPLQTSSLSYRIGLEIYLIIRYTALMKLLEYLVPSRARRELLRTLQAHHDGLSVRQLAQRTGLAYSNAHREVGQMKQVGLLRQKKVGKALVCTWNSDSAAARALHHLLRDLETHGAGAPGEGMLFWNLRRWGAPLTREGKPGRKLSLEETLAYGLSLARRHPELARVWPVVFAKNREALDLGVLVRLSRRLGQKRALGFFLSLTRRLLNDARLAKTERDLQDHRFRKTEDFFFLERGRRARELAEKRTPPVARDWHFRMNMPLESFRGPFEKFVATDEAVRR